MTLGTSSGKLGTKAATHLLKGESSREKAPSAELRRWQVCCKKLCTQLSACASAKASWSAERSEATEPDACTAATRRPRSKRQGLGDMRGRGVARRFSKGEKSAPGVAPKRQTIAKTFVFDRTTDGFNPGE